jgi:hypothetical protein
MTILILNFFHTVQFRVPLVGLLHLLLLLQKLKDNQRAKMP